MKKVFMCLCLALLLSGTASALTIVDLYGDKDGFGIGLDVNDDPIEHYPVLVRSSEDEGTITDQWLWGDQSYSHQYDISGIDTITAAQIEIVTLGQGWHGISSVYFDDIYIGDLSDGDSSPSPGSLDTNWVTLDLFDLMDNPAMLDGVNTIRIDTFGTNDDRWAMDYSELVIEGDASSAPVPEPATMLLMVTGLAGFFGFKRKTK